MSLELASDSRAASLKCVICQDTPLHPLLLTCQHYVCKTCAVQVKGSFKCPTCLVKTECSTAPVDILCPALLQGSLARQSLHCCGPSGDLEKSATSAVSWCTDCQRSFCNVCDSEHQRENRSHNRLAMDGLTRYPSRTCTDDKAELSMACFTCDKAKCFICAHSCRSSSHDILPFLHADFSEHIANFKSDISGLLWAVNSSVVRLDSHFIFSQRVAEAETRDIKVLEDSKKAAIDSINRAYDNAKQSLLACYDSVKTKAHTIYKGAQAVKTRVEIANKHWDNALKSDDNLIVFTQLSALKASVHKLVKSLSHAVDPIDAEKVVQSGVSLPDDLDCITSEWLGPAKVVKDDFVYLESETPSQVECEYTSKEAVQALPTFGAAYATIKLPFFCYDVSVTDDGHLLLADCNGHLLEYTTSGQELNRWRPPKRADGENDHVVSVETLSDGRVAVGLRYAKVVVLLKRVGGAAGDEAWLENERLDQLQVTPLSLSAYDDGLAVANICNSNVEVIRLSQRQQRSNNERTYHIKSVAITDKLIITVSFSLLEPSCSKRPHVVEAYTREGDEEQLLWRHELPEGEQARDVCVDATCHVVYLIVGKTYTTKGRVTAVSALDGTVLRNDVISFDRRFYPHKLSLSKTAKDASLAALAYESTAELSSTVSVYRSTLADTDVCNAKTEVTRL